ncbi:MAG: [Fe-Fe] hydrogenase large subunit C-terminal domain-containing protein [Thermodesulfobacteriota bacterium]|nr:[Fe-Fe] hydrogenase large subunit C-terminal domain-containing protein [Thermodesulfobacteriota bacterium]
MNNRKPLLFLNKERCRGCTHCIRVCPTEAIRIRRGKAEVMIHRCVQCGECLRVCPREAWEVRSGFYAQATKERKTVAVLDPTVFWQFGSKTSPRRIMEAFLEIGFTDVQDLGEALGMYAKAISLYLSSDDKPVPPISSTCPAVSQLVQVKYPALIENLAPVIQPFAIMARHFRKDGRGNSGKGLYYIVPCLARADSVMEIFLKEGMISAGAVPLVDVYNDLKTALFRKKEAFVDSPIKKTTLAGMKWAAAGGESQTLKMPATLIVDGIHRVVRVLELAESGLLDDVRFIEAWACPSGCLGGPLNVQDPFLARYHLTEWIRKNEVKVGKETREEVVWEIDSLRLDSPLNPRPGLRLDADLKIAMEKLRLIDETVKKFPGIDCGSCGCPSCLALAEDIVQGHAREKDCIYLMKEKN